MLARSGEKRGAGEGSVSGVHPARNESLPGKTASVPDPVVPRPNHIPGLNLRPRKGQWEVRGVATTFAEKEAAQLGDSPRFGKTRDRPADRARLAGVTTA